MDGNDQYLSVARAAFELAITEHVHPVHRQEALECLRVISSELNGVDVYQHCLEAIVTARIEMREIEMGVDGK